MGLEFCPLLQYLLKFLSYMCVNPYKSSVTTKILTFMNISSMTIIILASSYDVYLFPKGKLVVEEIAFISGLIMVESKLIWMKIKGDKIIELLQFMQTFWSINKFGPKIYEKYSKMHILILKCYKLASVFFYLTAFAAVISPHFTKEFLLVPGYYGCEESKDGSISSCLILISLLQIFAIVYTCTGTVLAFNGIFTLFISFAFINTELIKQAFKFLRLNERTIDYEMKEIILEHNRLLNFIEKIKKLYSEITFIQFALDLVLMVFCLNVMSHDGFPPKLKYLVLFGMVYVCEIIEASVFCVGGTLIDEQMLSIAEEAYKINWYGASKKVRKAIISIIFRAQDSQTLTAANLIKIDLSTLRLLIMNSFKICALIQTVEGIK